MAYLHVSALGRAYIERKEGCRLRAYRDIAGVWTIGYGCTGPDVYEGQVISQQVADGMLTRRLVDEFEPALNRLLGGAPTTQGQFDAMASLAFNIGIGGFARSSVLTQHRLGNYDKAADDFLLWCHAGGRYVEALEQRRQEEGQAYLDASPVSSEAA